AATGVLVIPDAIEGKPVTSIRNGIFRYCTSLTGITIPNSVTSIGAEAFFSCTNLTSITIGNGVTSIGDYAFYCCTSLTSITIGNSVESIGYEAFSNNNLTSITIPDSVTSIEGRAFYDNTRLTSVIFQGFAPTMFDFMGLDPIFEGVSSDAVAFVTSEALSSFGESGGIWNGLSIQVRDDTPNLDDLIYTTTGGKVTITECNESATGELIIPETIEGNPVTGIDEDAFYTCTSLTSITIPDSVTSIGNGTFGNCTSLTAIVVGAGNVTYMAVNGVLFNKEKTVLLTYPSAKTGDNYAIPNLVSSIGEGAFEKCTSLTSITIPDSITSIGEFAFWGCASLPSITIPDSVTSIGDDAFGDCASLTSITIPDSVTSIGYGTFWNCTSLTSITIPNGVTSIGEFAFWGCSSLASITIPDGITSVGAGAFSYCTSLTSITIPDSVTSIGYEAFYRCPSLTSIIFQGVAPTMGFNVFDGLPEGAQVYVSNEFADSFGGFGNTWEGLTVATITITNCGFVNATTFFIEFEPAGAGYRVMSSPTLNFGNAVEVTPTLQPTSGSDNRFEFTASGSRNFYRLEPTE
ncbi:leucine-rich repeat domain-containing protein, partial [Akkermansiaceae bacterium]|nr:leucine-rich repeat domain-containing protein [Akkermansiaceae bacterium]